MSRFRCRQCDPDLTFDDPIEHFKEAHPGHLRVISLGDIWNNTQLVYSDHDAPAKRAPKPESVKGQMELEHSK